MSLAEDSYGRAKRLAFIAATIRAHAPRRILDVGCGAGTQLTAPLAASFPTVEIIAIDEDAASLAWAREHCRAANLRFLEPQALAETERFDLIIASEVLEHVAEPDGFLLALRRRLAPDGRLLVTVPNGYGSFEWLALAEVLLNLSGLQALLRRLKGGSARDGAEAPPTLAVSPHVNFFSFGQLGRLFRGGGLAVSRYQPRTLFCGYLLDNLLRAPRLVTANAALVDRLPAWCASGWMFELSVECPPQPMRFRRGFWARFRKRLNEWRWGLV